MTENECIVAFMPAVFMVFAPYALGGFGQRWRRLNGGGGMREAMLKKEQIPVNRKVLMVSLIPATVWIAVWLIIFLTQ